MRWEAASRLRWLGVPLSRSGRQRKIGQMMGCCLPLAFVLLTIAATAVWALS